MNVCPYRYFQWYGCFWGFWVSFITTDEFPVSVTKITSKIGVSWTHNKGFWFWLIFNSMKWPYYQNNVKLSFTNITGLSMFKLCWMWILQWIKLSWHLWCMWDKLRWFSWFWQFLYEGLSSFNPKKGLCYSYACSCSLCEGRTSF